MKSNISLLTFLIAIAVTISCDRLTDTPDQTGTLHFLDTEMGGCNNQDFDHKNIFQESENDTIYYLISEDTLKFFIGINYICCAPFVTDYNILQDTITMHLEDTCPSPYSCYCRCMCYYTFLFQFNQFNGRNLHYNVILNNPTEKNPTKIFTGQVKK
jgi:hypothetical protein